MEQGNCMKTIKKKLIEAKRVFCFILACVLCVTAGSSFVYAKEEDSDQGILVEGEDYSEINFELYEYEKDPGLSGGDFLLMKAPAGAVPPEEGFLAKYEIDVEQAGTYQMDMTCLAINGNLGSTIEVRINDGDFKPYSEENAVNHGGVDGEVYKKNFFHYILDTVPPRSGKNTVSPGQGAFSSRLLQTFRRSARDRAPPRSLPPLPNPSRRTTRSGKTKTFRVPRPQ